MAMLLEAIVPPVEVMRWTLDEYHEMIESGYLDEDDNVELLEGWIVPKMPRNQPHDDTIEETNYLLLDILPRAWRIRIQSALAIPTAESQPEPDLAICGLKAQRKTRHPEPRDTALAIEVSDTTLTRDRLLKQRIYAIGRVPIYWIININDRQVEVYTDPTGPDKKPRYRRKRIYRNGDAVPLVIAGKEIGRIPVSKMLPV